MNKNPIVISKDAPITQCARKMLSNNVGAMIILEGEKLEGIITEKDIVEDVVAKEINMQNTKVSEIMSTIMITTSPDEDISTAVDIMIRENVRRLPVIKNNKLIGLLTAKDLLKAQPKFLKKLYDCLFSKESKK